MVDPLNLLIAIFSAFLLYSIFLREPYSHDDFESCGYDNLGGYDLYPDWKSVY